MELDDEYFEAKENVKLVKKVKKPVSNEAKLGSSGRFKYDDFHTIDWVNDLTQDRARHRQYWTKRKASFYHKLLQYFDASSGWLCVFVVAVFTGCIAGIIDIGVSWLKNFREGLCVHQFWFNKEQCCWTYNKTQENDFTCPEWQSWQHILKIKDGDSAYQASYGLYVLWSLLFAILAGLLVKTFAPYACSSGIPEIKTILSGYIIRGYLGKWTLLIKSVGLILAVSSGLCLGKEGPLIHIACCVGNIFTYFFPKYGKNEAKKREILSAAAAAGVSVAFHAPIGGVLFSLEEVSYYFPPKTMWRSFFCALVAAFLLRTIYPFGNKPMGLYYIRYDKMWDFIELVPFAFLGIVGGILGSLFIKCNIKLCKWRKATRIGHYTILEIIVVTLFSAVVCYQNPFTRIYTSDLLRQLIGDDGIVESQPLETYISYRKMINLTESLVEEKVRKPLKLLSISFFIKLVITILTYGTKLPTGLFIPSLALGAIYGRMLGILIEYTSLLYRDHWPFRNSCEHNVNCFSPGIYAMMGAAATLGGITRITVSLVVILSELTGTVLYIVPLMTAVMASKWVGDAFNHGGIYDAHISLNMYPFLSSKEEIDHTCTVEYVLRGAPPLCVLKQNTMTVDEIENLLARTPYNGFPVVADSQILVGFVLRNNLTLGLKMARHNGAVGMTRVNLSGGGLRRSLPGPAPVDLTYIVDLAPVTVNEHTSMDIVIEMFCKLGLRQVCITTNGKLVGIITKKDIMHNISTIKLMKSSSIRLM